MDEEKRMNKTEKELWRAVDSAVFGTNEPAALKGKLETMKSQFEREQSSLGRYLESLRRQLELSPQEIAMKSGVELETWKSWEGDFATPSREELQTLIQKMRWTRYFEKVLWKLWEEADRFRLKRLASFRPEFLAARGVSSEAGIAWQSVGRENQEKIVAWGRAHGHDFPKTLSDFLASLGTDEEQEAWVEEVLGG